MRKILALVLVIATLAVLAILPVSAARPNGVYAAGESSSDIHLGKAKFDGSTPGMSFGTEPNSSKGDLIVTEFLIDSSIADTTATDPSANCYNYIEIYNRGTTTVNLSNVAIVGIDDKGVNSHWDNYANFATGGMAFIDAGPNIYDGNGVKGDNGKYVHTGLDQTQANTNRQDLAPVNNPAVGDMDLAPGEFAIVWLWSDVCRNASIAEGESLAASMEGRDANFPKFRDHYAKLMGVEKYENIGTEETPEYVYTKEFQQIEDTLIVATHIDSSLNLNISSSSTIYALVDVSIEAPFDRTTEQYIIQGDKDNPYIHNDKIFSFFGWGTGGSRDIIGAVENSVTIYVPSASKAELYHAYKLMENEQYDIEANSDYVKIGITQSYLEMAVFSTVELPSIGSMPSYQWKYVDPDQMEAYATAGDTGYISDWWVKDKETSELLINPAIRNTTTGALLTDMATGATEKAWMSGTMTALIAERVQELSDDDLDAPEEDRGGTIVDQYWWETMLGSNKKKNTKDDGMPIWAIILIVVGAVLVAGGVAVAVIIIVKKKKAAATAAWYAEHANEIAGDGAATTAADDTAADAAADAAADDAAADDATADDAAADDAAAADDVAADDKQ